MKTLQYVLLLFLAVLFVTGCARFEQFGNLTRSDEVKEIFESATVLPDYTYYYSGPEARPDAIMALKNTFTLANEENLWIKVDITKKMLEDWNLVIRNEYRIKAPYYGFRILTPDGREAGVWYSKYEYTVIKTPEPDSIIIYTPVEPLKKPYFMDVLSQKP